MNVPPLWFDAALHSDDELDGAPVLYKPVVHGVSALPLPPGTTTATSPGMTVCEIRADGCQLRLVAGMQRRSATPAAPLQPAPAYVLARKSVTEPVTDQPAELPREFSTCMLLIAPPDNCIAPFKVTVDSETKLVELAVIFSVAPDWTSSCRIWLTVHDVAGATT